MGENLYEVTRTYRHKPFQIHEHMIRTWRGLKVLRINPGLTIDEFEQKCAEVTERNARLLKTDEDLTILWEITRGEYGWHGRALPIPPGKGKATVIIKNSYINQKGLAKGYYLGYHCVTPPTRHVPPQCWDPKIKTYNRLNYALAQLESKLVDPKALSIMQDIYGNLTETPGSAINLVFDGEIYMPTDNNILRSCTRLNVIKLAKEMNIRVVERDLQPWHLYNCDEAFVSVTSRAVVPIARFNGILIGKEAPGPVTRRMHDALSGWVGCDVDGLDLLTNEEKEALEKKSAELNEERVRLWKLPYGSPITPDRQPYV